ncbi:MAG: phosphoenolpyruvate synthase [Anaerolineae bacterium]
MTDFIRTFDTLSAADLPLVGGKGANLGELTRAGFTVPPGFCITTHAFERFMAEAGADVVAALDGLTADDLAAVRRAGQEIRARLARVPLPEEVAGAVIEAWQRIGPELAYAVRSSATAEDLPHASFAGQHDTYLNVRGEDALLESVRACFISLFTDRAILYRIQNGFDHRRVALAVVVQRMVQSEVSGILFTADPVSGHRHIVAIDASFGLGEALVSGIVSADLFHVDKRTGTVIKRQISEKTVAILPRDEGGTAQVALEGEARTRPALTDAQAEALARLGARIEAHFGRPQDVEWALAAGTIYVLQSRPITSLFPLPEPLPEDDSVHVYASISHVEVMTDPMPPLSLSLWRVFLPVGHGGGRLESRFVAHAGGRLFGDVTLPLRHPVGRRIILNFMKQGNPLAAKMLAALSERPGLLAGGERANFLPFLRMVLPYAPRVLRHLLLARPEGAPQAALARIQAHVAAVRARLDAAPDLRARVDVMMETLQTVFQLVLSWLPQMVAGLASMVLLNALMKGRAAPEDLTALGRGLVGNIETEVNLAVGDLADLVRADAELLAVLSQREVDARTRLQQAAALPGGAAFMRAWADFMAVFGARGPAEIDLSRPRWAEDPSSVLQMVLNATLTGTPGAHRAHYAQLAAEADAATVRVVAAARQGWWGVLRGPLVRRLIRVSRALTPLRGHHKFLMVHMMALIKPVLVEVGAALAAGDRLDVAEDVWFLTVPEMLAALDGDGRDLRGLVAARRADFAHFHTLTPPHVITSEGEIPAARLEGENAPEGALIGNPVSGGVVEGPAKVVLDPAETVLEPGEILVAPFTDPGWTPLFVNAAGLVTEVGGLMTHGSVVAREYGIPAVVGVVGATQRIRTGQRIRVNGDAGTVALLDGAEDEG